jgi:uncharacterized membrane protein YidH (DUF202 family)
VTASPAEDPQDQVERTLLSWRRTALSLTATALLVGHLAARFHGPTVLVVTLLGTAAVVSYVWLWSGRDGPVAMTGLAMVLGVLLLAVMALSAVLG